MKANWLKLAGAAALLVALTLVGTGCSDSSITSPSMNSSNLDMPQSAPGTDLGSTEEFSFQFTGHIDKIIPEDNLMILVEKGIVVKVNEDTKAYLENSRIRTNFRFSFVSVGNELTVHGELLEDNSVVAGLIEVLTEMPVISQTESR